jgi:hypothetical protein
LRRYSAGVIKRVLRLLEHADAELVEKLRIRLARFEGKPLDYTGERWKALLKDVREARAEAMKQYQALLKEELPELGKVEAAHEAALLEMVLPIEFAVATVSVEQLKSIAMSRPFQGHLLKDWFAKVEQQDRARLTQAIQLGMAQGETTDDIVRRIVGTRANKYADGILAISRRDAAAVARTAINHVSNLAREEVWNANADIISARIWTSTLDGRTSAVCRARDGRGSPVGDNPLPEGIKLLDPPGVRPPAHLNCRSTMVAYIDGVGLLGNRPTVVDIRTRNKREVDFRKIARDTGKPIQQVRKEWAAQHVGPVPSTTTYEEWLRRQSPAFQDEVLGRRKGQLFREGGLTLDQFVDRAGNELNLEELAALHPSAFARAA